MYHFEHVVTLSVCECVLSCRTNSYLDQINGEFGVMCSLCMYSVLKTNASAWTKRPASPRCQRSCRACVGIQCESDPDAFHFLQTWSPRSDII